MAGDAGWRGIESEASVYDAQGTPLLVVGLKQIPTSIWCKNERFRRDWRGYKSGKKRERALLVAPGSGALWWRASLSLENLNLSSS